jgi:uncharacterized protein YeaO (DUF488 family)
MKKAADIVIKRIYEEASEADGCRVLVDRLWPRGITKERAQLDEWNRDVAPSTELRKWFGHAPERFGEFAQRYRKEMAAQRAALQHLQEIAASGRLTLLIAGKNPEINHAAVLREILQNKEQL